MTRPSPEHLAREEFITEGRQLGLSELDCEEYAEAMMGSFGGHALVLHHAVQALRDDLRVSAPGRALVRLGDWLVDHLPPRRRG